VVKEQCDLPAWREMRAGDSTGAGRSDRNTDEATAKKRSVSLGLIAVALLAAGYAVRLSDQPKDAAALGESAAASSQAPVVRMAKSYRFAPPAIEIPAGTTLTWINDDNFTHIQPERPPC
jgi:plastocyanin